MSDRLQELFAELGLDASKRAQAEQLFVALNDLKNADDAKREAKARAAHIIGELGWGEPEMAKLTEVMPLLYEVVEFNRIVDPPRDDS